jgi:hypothetical protein
MTGQIEKGQQVAGPKESLWIWGGRPISTCHFPWRGDTAVGSSFPEELIKRLSPRLRVLAEFLQ